MGEAGRPRDHQRSNSNIPLQPLERLDRESEKPGKEVGEDVMAPDHEEKWVWLDSGTILNVDHRLANRDIVY